jgi:uridine kinase
MREFLFVAHGEFILTLLGKVIAVVGGSGAGKSTLVARLIELFPLNSCQTIMADDYYHDLSYLTPAERDQRNFDHPDAIDWPLLASHLEWLRQGQDVEAPVYDFATHTRKGRKIVTAAALMFVDGIMVTGQAQIQKHLDYTIFVDAPADLRFIRRLRRDVRERGRDMEGVIEQYLQTVRPMHHQFVEPLKSQANHVVDWSVGASEEVEAVAAKLRSLC